MPANKCWAGNPQGSDLIQFEQIKRDT
jgi:hypothetical protein